ncbi:MAG: CCA tRNA nucleotidyltransferase [Bacteriovoracaceae bacterium]|nr:CCA tRNA nucleotidyltransferase [Bacteriovoracaceae bacterium]
MTKKIPPYKEFFPENIRELLNYFLEQGFVLILIGGGTRDYLLEGTLPSDLDFEIRLEKKLTGDRWEKEIRQIQRKMETVFDLETKRLPFGIFRVKLDDSSMSLEFSSPRLEYFHDDKKALGHKDFDVCLESNLSHDEAFKRRDFTINAIGIEIKKVKNVVTMNFVDPCNGIGDLQKKIFRHCGRDVVKDPVRFLRLVRFLRKTGFNVHSGLKELIPEFNLEKLSSDYFLKEAFKAGAGIYDFSEVFFQLVNNNNIILPSDLKKLSFLGRMKILRIIPQNNYEVLIQLAMRGSEFGISVEDLEDWSRFSSIRKKSLKAHIDLKIVHELLLAEVSTGNIFTVCRKDIADAMNNPLIGLCERFIKLLGRLALDRQRLYELVFDDGVFCGLFMRKMLIEGGCEDELVNSVMQKYNIGARKKQKLIILLALNELQTLVDRKNQA